MLFLFIVYAFITAEDSIIKKGGFGNNLQSPPSKMCILVPNQNMDLHRYTSWSIFVYEDYLRRSFFAFVGIVCNVDYHCLHFLFMIM